MASEKYETWAECQRNCCYDRHQRCRSVSWDPDTKVCQLYHTMVENSIASTSRDRCHDTPEQCVEDGSSALHFVLARMPAKSKTPSIRRIRWIHAPCIHHNQSGDATHEGMPGSPCGRGPLRSGWVLVPSSLVRGARIPSLLGAQSVSALARSSGSPTCGVVAAMCRGAPAGTEHTLARRCSFLSVGPHARLTSRPYIVRPQHQAFRSKTCFPSFCQIRAFSTCAWDKNRHDVPEGATRRAALLQAPFGFQLHWSRQFLCIPRVFCRRPLAKRVSLNA